MRITADVVYLQETYVHREALRIRMIRPGKALALDRAYHLQPVDQRRIADEWTPQLVFFGAGDRALTAYARAQSLVVEPVGAADVLVEIELDHEQNHPFQRFRECWDTYARSQEDARDAAGAWRRRPGQHNSAAVTLVAGDVTAVRKWRFPRARLAALVFTDHADQSDLPRLEALMFGRSPAPERPERGFASRQLGMTKTMFARQHGRYGPQLSNPAYRGVAERLSRDSGGAIEVVPHSISGARDTYGQTRAGLEVFGQLASSRVWIDHQPSTNCEAVVNRGLDRAGRYRTTELLREYGYRYVWAAIDVAEPRDGINLLDPARADARRPLLYRHSLVDDVEEPALWLFTSLWRALPFERFLESYDERRLDALEHGHGIHIAHTYLDSYKTTGRTAPWSLLEERAGQLHLKSRADALFSELQRRHEAGSLWVTGIAAMGDHLLAMRDVAVDYLPDGSALITNTSETLLEGATILIPSSRLQPVLDGEPAPRGRVVDLSEGGRLLVLRDLAPHGTTRLELRAPDGSRAPLMRAAGITLDRRPAR